MSRIYISRREGDAPQLTEQAIAHLRVCFGEEALVFPAAPEEGFTLRETVREAVGGCEGMVVFLGPRWRQGTGPGSPGLRDPKDRIRLEVEAALERNLLLLPVPLGEAPFPRVGELPRTLAGLTRHPAQPVTTPNLKQDLARLAHRLETGLALRTIVENSSLKRGSIHHRALPKEDLLGLTDANRPQDVLGLSRSNLSETRRAIDYQETALNLARRTQDRAAESRALGKLGLAFGKLGETARAIEYFEQQIQIVREIGTADEKGALLANLGDAWAVRGEFARAIRYYNEQLGLALECNDRDMEAAAQVGLGHCHIKLGGIERGVGFYERALKRIRETGEPAEQARLLVGLGLNYRKLGRTQEALVSLRQALDLARRIGDRTEEGCLLGDLSDTYQQLGEITLAAGFREQQLELVREVGDARAEAEILMHLARHHHAQGEPARALELAEAAAQCAHVVDASLFHRIEGQIAAWKKTASQ